MSKKPAPQFQITAINRQIGRSSWLDVMTAYSAKRFGQDISFDVSRPFVNLVKIIELQDGIPLTLSQASHVNGNMTPSFTEPLEIGAKSVAFIGQYAKKILYVRLARDERLVEERKRALELLEPYKIKDDNKKYQVLVGIGHAAVPTEAMEEVQRSLSNLLPETVSLDRARIMTRVE